MRMICHQYQIFHFVRLVYKYKTENTNQMVLEYYFVLLPPNVAAALDQTTVANREDSHLLELLKL